MVVDVFEYTGVIVDLSLQKSWWRWRRTRGRIGRFQVETGWCAHSLSVNCRYDQSTLNASSPSHCNTHQTTAILHTAVTVCFQNVTEIVSATNGIWQQTCIVVKLKKCSRNSKVQNSLKQFEFYSDAEFPSLQCYRRCV